MGDNWGCTGGFFWSSHVLPKPDHTGMAIDPEKRCACHQMYPFWAKNAIIRTHEDNK